MSRVDAALEAAQEAKAVYREQSFAENRDRHREAAAELRYRRWVARGGPEIEAAGLRAWEELNEVDPQAAALVPLRGHTSRPAREHYDRWLVENKKG